MPYHQAALAVEQLRALLHLPVLAAGLRGVQHTEAPGRVPSLVHRPEHGQLADPRLALKGEQLARGVSRIHLLAPAQPQRPGADQASQEHAGGRRGPGGRSASGLDQLHVHNAAEAAIAAHVPAVDPRLAPGAAQPLPHRTGGRPAPRLPVRAERPGHLGRGPAGRSRSSSPCHCCAPARFRCCAGRPAGTPAAARPPARCQRPAAPA